MTTDATRPAWVALPSESELREVFPPGHPYDFGFLPAMARLVAAHDEIGVVFGLAFNRIMFGPGALSRTEREMVASVAAAAQDCHY